MTRDQLINLVLSEYAYWRDASPDGDDDVILGAMAASSNILAAVMGFPARHHKLPPTMLDLHCTCGASLVGRCEGMDLIKTVREWFERHSGDGHKQCSEQTASEKRAEEEL